MNRINPAREPSDDDIRRAIMAETSAMHKAWSDAYMQSEQFTSLCGTVESNAIRVAEILDELDDSEAAVICAQNNFPAVMVSLCRRFNAGCIIRVDFIMEFYRATIPAKLRRPDWGITASEN